MEDDSFFSPLITPTFLRASAAMPNVRLVKKIDRRDARARAALVARITNEFHESPGLSITLPQGERLFGLREDICVRILEGLVSEGALGRTSAGVYYWNRVTA